MKTMEVSFRMDPAMGYFINSISGGATMQIENPNLLSKTLKPKHGTGLKTFFSPYQKKISLLIPTNKGLSKKQKRNVINRMEYGFQRIYLLYIEQAIKNNETETQAIKDFFNLYGLPTSNTHLKAFKRYWQKNKHRLPH